MLSPQRHAHPPAATRSGDCVRLGTRPLPEPAETSESDAERSPCRKVDQLRPGDHVVIAGAGPAGLTAAYLLAKDGVRVTVLEADGVVGGIARTVEYRGYRFDIGGHRFFTKIAPVEALWRELLGDEFIKVPRLSRIHYEGRYFDYPLKATNALRGLGLLNTLLVLASYLRAHLWPSKPEDTFEQWVSNRFGRRLYRIFFKTYTEKVWGIPCSEIRAEWAAQRIQGLSLWKAMWSATSLQRRAEGIKSLIHEFDYPRLGPGQMWERARDRIIELGGQVRTGHRVTKLERCYGRVAAVRAHTSQGEVRIAADHFISTMPVGELVHACTPEAPRAVRRAGDGLSYRDLLVVALIVRQRDLFPDNWIYIHTPGVRVGRIQNVSNWSRAMVPDPSTSCVEMEYFCFEGDEMWTRSDEELVALARGELAQLGLADPCLVVDGTVVRTPKAYPVYDSTYRSHLDVVRRWLDEIPNLHTIGRNGMHKYNNQDHSMLTAMLALDNMRGALHDLWEVNTDYEYHEHQRVTELAHLPPRRGVRARSIGRRWLTPQAEVT
jgi:protoporphyrinogen oxidase